jgi:ankyrin repeat protein
MHALSKRKRLWNYSYNERISRSTCRENGGQTALMIACRQGCERAVTLLLDRDDIDTTLKDEKGRTAYDVCDGISDAIKARLKERMG